MHPFSSVRRALLIVAGLSSVAIGRLPIRAVLIVVAVCVTVLIARIRTSERRSGEQVSPP